MEVVEDMIEDREEKSPIASIETPPVALIQR